MQGEAAELAGLAEAGLDLAPMVWIPPDAEEAFYRLNGLPSRLAAVFEGVASHDPDEDDVEELAPQARALLGQHALLDAWVDAFYEAVGDLPARLRVRRPGDAGREAARGRPALLALRATWADDWSDDAVLARLRATGSVALEAAPVLLHGSDDDEADDARTARVQEALGVERRVRIDADGRIVRLGSATRPRSGGAEG